MLRHTADIAATLLAADISHYFAAVEACAFSLFLLRWPLRHFRRQFRRRLPLTAFEVSCFSLHAADAAFHADLRVIAVTLLPPRRHRPSFMLSAVCADDTLF